MAIPKTPRKKPTSGWLYNLITLECRITDNTPDFGSGNQGSIPCIPTRYMVVIAELVKHLIVVQESVGS